MLIIDVEGHKVIVILNHCSISRNEPVLKSLGKGTIALT